MREGGEYGRQAEDYEPLCGHNSTCWCGAPIGLHALRRELESRVRSTGGRPALDGATKIQKIPLKPEDWSRLEDLAARLSREGVSATAGQVASVMVHKQLRGQSCPSVNPFIESFSAPPPG